MHQVFMISFYPKYNSKLELFKVLFKRLLYKDEEIDVFDIDISS